INGVFNFANTTSGRVPVSDWYRVADGTVVTFAARPVVGGFLALLPRRQTGVTQWVRIQNKHSGKLLAVQNQSTANSAEVTQYSDNGTPDHLWADRKSTRLNSSHDQISYAVFCLKKKKK